MHGGRKPILTLSAAPIDGHGIEMKRCSLALLLGFLSGIVSHAQPLPGEYTYNFGTNLPVFYLDETFSTNLVGSDEMLTMELTPQGRFRGTYSGHADDGTVVLDLSGNPTGRFSGISPEYHLSLRVRGTLRGTAYGRPVAGTFTLSGSGDLDATTGVATGRRHVVVCLPGRGCQTVSDSFSFDSGKPEIGEGDWSLSLNISNQINRVTGTARATLTESGRTVDFRVRGTYSPRRELVKLQLQGIGDAAGVLIRLEADSAMKLQSIRGKLFGQRIDSSGDNL